MKPLGEDFLKIQNWDEVFSDASSPNLIIGFLIDSPFGDLKRSGLISRSEAVINLDQILTSNNARIFYIDPRNFSAEVYKNAVELLDNFLNEMKIINFELSKPYLLLMQKSENQYTNLKLLNYDKRIMCMWYSFTYEFLESYFLENKKNGNPAIKDFIKKFGGAIRDESLKAVAVKLVNSLLV